MKTTKPIIIKPTTYSYKNVTNMTAPVLKWFVNEEFERGNTIYPFEVTNEKTGEILNTWAQVNF